MTTQPEATQDDEIEAIAEGIYRWTIDTINFSIRHSKDGLNQEILGTGQAPLLSPSEASKAIEAYVLKKRYEEASWWSAVILNGMTLEGYRKKRIADLTKQLEALTGEKHGG